MKNTGKTTMQEYYTITDNMHHYKNKITELLANCFWSKNIPIEYVERFIKYSLCFGVMKKLTDELVGFGRVVSDFTTYAYICDIVIAPEHRKKRLATMLINEIINHNDLKGIKTFSLTTTEEARNIYQKSGFKKIQNVENQLEISNLEIYSHPDFINIHK
jgi:ribosomal protein S18 acetylase RimI-like enzyme